MSIHVDVETVAHLSLGSLSNTDKWKEEPQNARVQLYLSHNAALVTDRECCPVVAGDGSAVRSTITGTSIHDALSPAVQLRVEAVVFVLTAEGRVCQHRLGVAGVPLSALTPGSIYTLRLFEPRVDTSTGTVTLTVHAADLPPFVTTPTTRYVDMRIHDVDERGRSIAAAQLRLFFDGLAPAMPALNNVHCPLLGPYLPGGWFSRIRPAATR